MLEQQHSDGKYHVVSYASRTCSKAEAKLGPTDGELLAILYAVEKFHHHIAGTTFTIVTDHSALVHLNSAKNPKLARWAMKLASYNYNIQHRAGRVHNNADGLSRSRAQVSPDTPPDDRIALEELSNAHDHDPACLAAALDTLHYDDFADGDVAPLMCEPVGMTAQLGPR